MTASYMCQEQLASAPGGGSGRELDLVLFISGYMMFVELVCSGVSRPG
jgi:hypothetical protein